MKQFISSKILRKMMVLAVLMTGLIVVTSSENARAARVMTLCCTTCQAIAAYCTTHYGGPNDPYKSFKECVIGEGGQDCIDGICDTGC